MLWPQQQLTRLTCAAVLPATASVDATRRAAVTKELQRAADVLEWEIDEKDIFICTHADGTDVLLGAGGFGKVVMLPAA